MDISAATCDLHRQHRGIRVWSVSVAEKKTCFCNSPAPQALRFVFMWFQPANPDQTVILIGVKNILGFTFKYLRSPTFINDRQTTACQASIIWCYALLRSISAKALSQNKQQVPSISLHILFYFFGLLFYFFKFHIVALWQACGEVFFFFFYEGDIASISLSVFLKARARLTLYLLLLRQLKEGIPQWHLVEQPCQLFVCILNSFGRRVFLAASISSWSLPMDH